MKAARPRTPARPAPERAAALPAPAVGRALLVAEGAMVPMAELVVLAYEGTALGVLVLGEKC